MEVILRCPQCTNLVCTDIEETIEDSYIKCPKCGHLMTSLYTALRSHFINTQRECSDFVIQQGTLIEYNGHSRVIDLPASVTFIKDGHHPLRSNSYMFYNSTDDVVMGCFEGNDELEEFYSTTSLLVIGAHAFANCKKLKKVALCEGLIEIGRGAFEGCESLEEIQIPATCRSIHSEVFQDCKNLKRVIFINKASDYLHYPAWIGIDHRDNELSRIDAMGNYVPNIPNRQRFEVWDSHGLFNGCSSLCQINLPKCITEISKGCFSLCTSLQSIDLTDYEMLESIGENAFYGCTSLRSVRLPTCLIGDSRAISHYSERRLRICRGAFCDCASLETINIPDFVNFDYGDRPFDGCNKLEVTISTSKMLEDYYFFLGSGPDGNGLNRECLFASIKKYYRLQSIKGELQEIVYERKRLLAQRNNAGFFEFSLKSRLNDAISELNVRERELTKEGFQLDEAAKNELRALCSKFNVSFYDDFCKSTDSSGLRKWQDFEEWRREELYHSSNHPLRYQP